MGFSFVLCPTHRRVKYKRLCDGSQVLVTGADLRLLGALPAFRRIGHTANARIAQGVSVTRISLRIHQHG